MLGLMLIVYPLLEIYVLIKVGQAVGFMNVFFALLAGFVLGLGIAKSQGRYIVARLKGSLEKKAMPPHEVQHGLVVFIAGLFIAAPGFISDLVGFLLLIPGTRHLFVRVMRRRLEQRVRQGGFAGFSFGQFGGQFGAGGFSGGFGKNFGGGPFGATRPKSDEGVWEREVSPKVIDVSPINRSTHKTESGPKPKK